MKNLKRLRLTVLSLCTLCLLTGAYGQITPSGDAYTNTATPTVNFGAKTLLDVESASQTTYIQFDLSAIPSGYTSANITKATLKVYVNSVTTAGSLNVDFVNGTWSESKITASNAPALGSTIAASVPLTTADKNQYLLIDITTAVGAWLNGTDPNDGIALVGNSPLNATFDSKENTATSHPAELDIVYAGGGTITGVTTASGSGLTGGGMSGTLNLSLTNTCATNQVLQWSGSAWACAAVSTGTVTSVGSGAGLTGGPITGSGSLSIATGGVSNAMLANSSLTINPGTDLVGGGLVSLGGTTTLNVDTTKIPQLGGGNVFTGTQTVNGNLTVVNNSAYQPFWVQSSSTFGTWMALGNTSTGGHTWNIISAASGNAEGAGNIGITDLTGKSTIWLEGPVQATSTLRVGGPPAAGGVAASFGGNGDFAIDAPGSVAGRFVVKDSTGNVGINNPNPTGARLDVVAGSTAVVGIQATGYSPSSGSDPRSGDGIDGFGGNGVAPGFTTGGAGVAGYGGATGAGSLTAGPGGFFAGGSGGGDGVEAIAGTGSSYSDAGYFVGDIQVTGAVHAMTKDFKIDHPLDPANKYLFHASVESSEMMNIYTGNVTTDSQSQATVQLPEWFEVLNTDFRYQLTVIGQFAQAIVGRKIENNRFEIKTSAPNVEVSWQVTGVRQDAYAKAHPLVVEQEKETPLRGFYIQPELYGAPEEKQIEWARHPQLMQRVKEIRTQQLATSQKQAATRPD